MWHYRISRLLLLLALPRGWGTKAWLRCDWRLWLNSFSFPFYLLFLFWNLIFVPSFLPVFNALVSFAEPRSTLSGPRIANIALMPAVPSFQRNPTLILIFDILSMLLTNQISGSEKGFLRLVCTETLVKRIAPLRTRLPISSKYCVIF